MLNSTMPSSTAGAVLGIADTAPLYDDAARALVAGRPVLVTGAGGSIGSEIVRQLTALGAAPVICVDRDEYALYRLQLDLTGRALLTSPAMVLADVGDWRQMGRVMAEHRPALVFHAAAVKHLPLLERSPAQAILTNIGGTAAVTAAAARSGVARLVNISTDKAANPVSVLGQTKAAAETMVLQYAAPPMLAASVRFGNVYGSRGSFVETLAHQVARGLPVTVTDRGMTRYFMTIGQAAGLVIAAAVLADSESTFILDMGAPVRMTDLVRRYAEHAGVPAPEILCTGARAGEKLAEQLAGGGEESRPTRHPLITAIRGDRDATTAAGITELITAARRGDHPDELRAVLSALTTAGCLALPVGA